MNKLKLCVACAPVLAALALAPAASAWAPAATAAVHPGVQTFTQGAQCTSNFIFQSGSTVYIGQAAHCSGTGGNTATDGCTSGTLPVGTQVQVTGASKPGTMVYNSWATMQGLHEANADTCAFNDLALVQLAPLAGSNGVGDLAREIAYMQAHGGPGANVVPGTQPFNPSITAAILGL